MLRGMEDKLKGFREFVSDKENRKILTEAGFKYSVVYSWGTTERLPSEKNAKKIAATFGLPLSEIPYYRTERVI